MGSVTIKIVGQVDTDRLYCAGSLTKLLTTYVCLTHLAEDHQLANIVDDENTLDRLATNKEAKDFLHLFQRIIGSKFTIRDLCSYYTGLPYTFSMSDEELLSVEKGNPLKHHSIPDEETFLSRCQHNITPIYKNRSRFHYSELSIIFLGYFLEKSFNLKIADLYQKYLIKKFNLTASAFSAKLLPNVYCQDLSDVYDYPSIGIMDHGYFC